MAEGGGVDINTGVLHDEEFDYPCTMCLKKNRNKEANISVLIVMTITVIHVLKFMTKCLHFPDKGRTYYAVIATNKNRLGYKSCFNRKM
jgi:hypothetical protein